MQLESGRAGFEAQAVSPFREMGAYEALWSRPGTTFASLAARFAGRPGSVPSDFVAAAEADASAAYVKGRFAAAGVERFGVRVHGAGEYPPQLRDAVHPVELLYFEGWWDLAASPSVAVVGTRRPSADGLARTRRLVRAPSMNSGGGGRLYGGVGAGGGHRPYGAHGSGGGGRAYGGGARDAAVACLSARARRPATAVGGGFLVISQVPLRRYEAQDWRRNRAFFPARNVTMAALTEATIVVEAGATSGTLIQARAALGQGRKLFVLDNCFRDRRATWAARLVAQGAVRVRTDDDIRARLSAAPDGD